MFVTAFSISTFAADRRDLDNTLFGLTFGKEFQAVPCEMKGTFAQPPNNGYCVEPMNLVTNENTGATGNARVKFASFELPYWTGGKFVIELIDGKLEGVSMGTAGVGSRPIIVDALTKKYGPPHITTPMPMQNAFGASYDGSIVEWSDGKLNIRYAPISNGNTKEGLLQIFTPIGAEAFAKRMKEIFKNIEPKRAM
jgi:hypothetical protein